MEVAPSLGLAFAAGAMNLCMDAPHGHGLRRATSGGKLASPDGELLASFVQQDRQHAQVGADWGGRHVRPKQQDQAGVLAAARGGSAALGGKPIILQYAAYLGMNVAADTDLLWIAQQALTAELPQGWAEHSDPMSGDSYFHNENTGETVWEHPCDSYYRNLYQQLKKEKEQHATATGLGSSGSGFTAQEISMAVGTAGVAGAGGDVSHNRYLAPIAQAESELRKDSARRREKNARRQARRVKTEAKRRRRQDRAVRRIQRAWRCHKCRTHLAQAMRQRRAATMVQARLRGNIFRRRMRCVCMPCARLQRNLSF